MEKKEDWFLNFFLIILSYALLVIVDNLTHLVWKLLDLNLSKHWLIYMLVNYPIFWVVCKSFSKTIVRIKNKKTLRLSSKTLTLLCIDLILCLLIFILNITIVKQMGSPWQILLIGIVMYMAYFVCTYFMVTTIINECDRNAEIMTKQNSYDNLQEYMLQIEDMYQNLQTFKHDYANIMFSMTGFIEEDNMKGLKDYCEQQIFPISNQLSKQKDAISGLHNLHIVELKSLLYVKIVHAQELNININLEITERIDEINIKSVDLVRVIGILLDNAIEACQECNQPNISFSIVKEWKSITFILRNSYVRYDIDYSKLGNLGVSSKGERRGTGLYNVKSILKGYPNIILDTEYPENYFTQFLEIYERE